MSHVAWVGSSGRCYSCTERPEPDSPCWTGGTNPSLVQATGPTQVQAVLSYCVKRVMCGWPESESNCWVTGEASLEAELCSSKVTGEQDVLRQQVKCRE